MNILLILFSISFVGIVGMIGRKLLLLPAGAFEESEFAHPFVPDFERLKSGTQRGMKKFGHFVLVTILRIHVRSTDTIRDTYKIVKARVRNMGKKNGEGYREEDQAEVSKFLTMISEYKQKIREIKHRIREEDK